MPGHVKLGKTGEPDPDPSPYLVVSMEMKREAMVSFLVLICIWEVSRFPLRPSRTTPRSRCGALMARAASRNAY